MNSSLGQIAFCGKRLILGVVATLLVGCGATPNNHVADYETNVAFKYPPISVFYDSPSETLKQQCHAFNQKALSYCSENNIESIYFWQDLKTTGMFEDVYYADRDSEFKIAFATVGMHSENAGDITKAALAGATLLLVPMTTEQEIRVEVGIYWRNIKVKQYDYQLPYISTVSLFSNPTDADKNFAQTLVSHVIADIQKDDLFSPSTISTALKATDYNENLVVPDAIGDFQLARQFSYYDPFLGNQTTYVNPDYGNDLIDLFVYPIRKTDFEDTQAVLAFESTNIRKELEIVIKEQKWQDLTFSEAQPVTYVKDGVEYQGIGFDGSYTNELGEETFTSVYLFALEDKFVKWRASFPAEFIKQQVTELMPQISVPSESLFMAKLRQNSRKQEMN